VHEDCDLVYVCVASGLLTVTVRGKYLSSAGSYHIFIVLKFLLVSIVTIHMCYYYLTSAKEALMA